MSSRQSTNRQTGKKANPLKKILPITILAAILAIVYLNLSNTSPKEVKTIAPTHNQTIVIGNIPYWDQQNAFYSAEKHSNALTDLYPWWYTVADSGDVVVQDESHVNIDIPKIRSFQKQHIRVMPVIANHQNGQWNYNTISSVLHNPSLSKHHTDSIVELVLKNQYDGAVIDYEDLKKDDREAFSSFIEQLAHALHAKNKKLTVYVHPKASDAGYDERNLAQDYTRLGKAADWVAIMIYDWHWSTSEAGPIAPIDWVNEVLTWSKTQIAPSKIIHGIGLYGYDWVGKQGSDKTSEEIALILQQTGTTPSWDKESASPWFHYEQGGIAHEVWFENSESIKAKFTLSQKYKLAGIAFWRLGGEDPTIWDIFTPTK